MELLWLFHLQRAMCKIDYIIETDIFTKGKLSNRQYAEEFVLYAW